MPFSACGTVYARIAMCIKLDAASCSGRLQLQRLFDNIAADCTFTMPPTALAVPMAAGLKSPIMLTWPLIIVCHLQAPGTMPWEHLPGGVPPWRRAPAGVATTRYGMYLPIAVLHSVKIASGCSQR